LANLLQQLNDSQPGVVIGTALHTLGAIGLLGGLIAYVAWHRHLARGQNHAQLLHFATFLTYVSILANLAGGFMRTYETGHPHVTAFASSAWVRAIAIKHAFLFLGMGAAVFLLERVAPRLRRALKEGRFAEQPQTGHRVGVLLVALGILVAAVLGAVSTVLPVGEAAAPEEPEPPVPDGYLNASGTYQATPLSPGSAGGELPVPAGMADIEVVLTWSAATSSLGIQIVAPDGVVVKDLPGSGGRVEGALGRAPEAGTWTYRITSPDPVVSTQYAVAFHLPAGNGTHSH
jgi:hypothetical protein